MRPAAQAVQFALQEQKAAAAAGDESVVVGVRVRPFNDREKGLKAECCVEMSGPTTTIYANIFQKDNNQKFTFDESFWSHDGFDVKSNGYCAAKPGCSYADQRYVYDKFGQRVLDNAWAGFHCCLFAYGQTGAGKSYSMVGYGANKGIVPISTEEIFKRITKSPAPNMKYEVTCSMIEIYNETVQDLLVLPEDRPKKGLDIRESKLLGIYIEGVVKRPVASYVEIEATVEEATEHRTVGATLMNATSSRAHTVVAVEFKQLETIDSKVSEKCSVINLVDLAGSEKSGQTGATGDRLKEGSAINKSLSALGNVIEKLAQRSGGKKNVLIPYRDSKLTRLLQNALGGSSKTIMICALSPASSNYEETLSTLRYADRAKKIKNNAQVNENPQDRLLRELKEENQKLKEMMEKMKQTGNVDVAALNEKQAEIAEAEAALKEMQRSFADKCQEEVTRQNETEARKSLLRVNRKTFASGGARGQVCPHFANLNEDMTLTGRIKHEFPMRDGEVTILTIGQVGGAPNDWNRRISRTSSVTINGATVTAKVIDKRSKTRTKLESSSDSETATSDSALSAQEEEVPDIKLVGAGIYSKHAQVTNDNGKCYFLVKGQAAEETFVNGKSLTQHRKSPESRKIKGDALLLEHGDRIAIGRLLFVFVDPEIGRVEVLVNSGQASYMMAAYELEKAGKRLGTSRTTADVEKDKLRAKIAEQDRELRQLRDEVQRLRARCGEGSSDLSKAKGAATAGAGLAGRENASLARAKGIAAELRKGFDYTVSDLEKAVNSLDAVRRAMQGLGVPNEEGKSQPTPPKAEPARTEPPKKEAPSSPIGREPSTLTVRREASALAVGRIPSRPANKPVTVIEDSDGQSSNSEDDQLAF